jgi:ClpP class serine protease
MSAVARRLTLEPGRPYALDARAIGELLPETKAVRPNYDYDCVTVVSVAGPLRARTNADEDSYEEIIGRVASATVADTQAIVLELSTPGGDAAGCVEAARKIRAICQLAGKPLYAWVVDRANSAGYALACGADKIILSESGIVGSIGIIATRTDTSVAARAAGVTITHFASGARKADGYSDVPLSEPEAIASQRLVDSLANVFFGLVKERRGVNAQALQAGVFHGADAVSAGLADSIMSLDQLVTNIKAGPIMSDSDEVRKALQKAASGDGPDAQRAVAALAAWDKSDGADAADETESPADAADDTTPADAADESEPAGDDDDKPAPKGASAMAARAMNTAARALAAVHTMKVERAREKAVDERSRLLATRPDLDADLAKTLRDPSCPIATVRNLVATLPRLSKGAGASAALSAAGANPTIPDLQGVGASRMSAEAKLELDRRMGVIPTKPGVVSSEFTLQLGVPVADTGKAG